MQIPVKARLGSKCMWGWGQDAQVAARTALRRARFLAASPRVNVFDKLHPFLRYYPVINWKRKFRKDRAGVS